MASIPPQPQIQHAGMNQVPFAPQQMAALPHGMAAALPNQPVVGTMTQPFAMGQPFAPGQHFITPFAHPQMTFPTQFHNGGHNITQEQLAAAFLQQKQHPVQSEPAPSAHEAVAEASGSAGPASGSAPTVSSSSGGTIAPPPPPARPVHRRTSQSAQSGPTEWPDENKENGSSEEPVWVLRDSYLKRMQREQKEQRTTSQFQERAHEWNGDANAAAAASSATAEVAADEDEMETDRLLLGGTNDSSQSPPSTAGHGKKKNSKESMHSHC
ncbi:hypothetical protein ANCDUO_07197 [Ancylostoma duodenale]|uniref:Uncharacterized protein n=1 Tax=Ancylostoma duodenale TaxID=51022 RepID=A0A0C2GMN0_9BILA|nr:hypothetical protein ANCDUO_07197 [Ancylostoma duodenale]